MNSLKKIAYNCRKATFLIEKKSLSRISIKEQLALKYHLAGCSVCQLFEKQSKLINQMIKKHFAEEAAPKLDPSFKEDLSKRIDAMIDSE